MKCSDHPEKDAVAMLHSEKNGVKYSIGVCHKCFMEWQKTMNLMN